MNNYVHLISLTLITYIFPPYQCRGFCSASPSLPVAAIFLICQRSFQYHCQDLTFKRLIGHDTPFAPVRSAVITGTTTSIPFVIQCVGLLHTSSGKWYRIVHTSKMRACQRGWFHANTARGFCLALDLLYSIFSNHYPVDPHGITIGWSIIVFGRHAYLLVLLFSHQFSPRVRGVPVAKPSDIS
ncbi:hypothetical protein EDB87DRAFT_213120 [Lactarius vividus]|nr:hypothetical protein EDB87DRAFT_213120 [Lactarius vividus]